MMARTKSSKKSDNKKQIVASRDSDDVAIAPDVLEFLHEQGLTFKQFQFAHEIIADPSMNIGEATIRAGYAVQHAQKQGSRNLQIPAIRKVINRAMRSRAKRLFITQDNVLMDILNLARSNPQDYFNENGDLKDINELTADQARCIQHVETVFDKEGNKVKKITFHSKIKPLELLARHVGVVDSKAFNVLTDMNDHHQISVDNSAEHMAKVLTILMKSGAITSDENIQEAEYEEVSA